MTKTVNLSRLPENERRIWWEKIKQESPKMVELLKHPQLVELRKKLNGDILITVDDDGKIINGND